eukprot:TRINITY_DN9391_c0_g1_i1.p1 TRINITY_DN9391_c0_g1~~TRINITY_DN9391_c0_g1_i1.p1  ORF type:complete len:472 (+),score=125.59 TRINITY_DN9391_c0_g1_i1:32-1447(+)
MKRQSVWDEHLRQRIVILIDYAKDIINPRTIDKEKEKDKEKEFKNLQVHVTMNKIKYHTSGQRRTAEPRFAELFSYDVVAEDKDKDNSIKIKLLDGSDEIGTHIFRDVDSLPSDIVMDKWLPLTFELQKKKKEASETINTGQIHVLFLVSKRPELRPMYSRHCSGPDESPYHYHQSQIIKRGEYKTGDVILVSGFGPLAIYTKLVTNTQFSFAGMVISLPNKFSKEEELYVFFLSQNTSDLPDSFSGRPLYCLPSLVPLQEFIHGVYGAEVWYLPNKKAFSLPEYQRIKEWVCGVWEDYYRIHLEVLETQKQTTPPVVSFTPFSFNEQHTEWLEQWGIQIKIRRTFADILSSELIVMALKNALRIIPTTSYPIFPIDLVKSGAFGTARLIRSMKDNDKVPEIMNTLITPESVGSAPVFEPRKIIDIPAQAPPLPPVNDDLLPEGWEMRTTPDGKIYYINKTFKKSQWRKPE